MQHDVAIRGDVVVLQLQSVAARVDATIRMKVGCVGAEDTSIEQMGVRIVAAAAMYDELGAQTALPFHMAKVSIIEPPAHSDSVAISIETYHRYDD